MATENIDIRVSEDGSRVVRRRLDDIADGADRAQNSVDRMNNLLKMVGKYLVASEVMKWADAWSVASSSIKIATSNTYEFVQVQGELFKIAQRSRQEFGALAELYAAVARQSENLKTSQQGLLVYTENIAKALAIQHTSMAAARGPLLQLGQAMASGKIRAQEFNSIMLGLPYVMKIVAENFKGGSISVMQLRSMMLQGKLESIEFFEAFQRGSKQINDDFNKTQVTFSQAFTIFRNELVKFTGTMDSTTGASAKFASVLKFVAENLALLTSAAVALTAGLKLGPILERFVAMRAESAAAAAAVVAANTEMAASEAATSAASLAAARASVAKTEADLANVRATQGAILISREAAIATLAKANSDILASRASIQAATNAGALSYALAVKRDAEVALTAAEVRRSAALAELAVLGQQQARVTVIQTEATAAHALAVRSLAAAQVTGAESAAAYALAQGGAASAAGRVGVAAGAATIATRLFTGAVALMGGPIGIVITALIGLAVWLYNVKSNADDAKAAIDAVNRVNAAKAGGPGARQSDAEKIYGAQQLAQKQLEAAEDKLANLEKNIEAKKKSGNEAAAKAAEAAYGPALRDNITKLRGEVEKYGKAMEDAKTYSAETGGAAGAAARQLSQARGAWEASIGSVKTATTIQENYTNGLDTSRKAHQAYIEELKKNNKDGIHDSEIQKAASMQIEVEKSLEKERDAALKGLRNQGAEVKKQVQVDADERMSVIQVALENEISVRRNAYESEKRMLDAKHQNGLLSEAQFMASNLQMVQRYDQEERAIIKAGSVKYREAYESRRKYIQKTLDGKREKDALTELDSEYGKFVSSVNSKLQKLGVSGFERQGIAISKLNGELNKLEAQDKRYWAQADANVSKDEAAAAAKRKLVFATEEQQAASEAYIRTGEAHNAQLMKLQDAYDSARSEADNFSASIDWSEAGSDAIAILEAMNDTADKFGKRLKSAYETLDVLKKRSAEAAAEAIRNKEFDRNVMQVSDAIESAIFDGGKAGGKKLTDWLKTYFLRNPLRIFLQGQLSIAGQAMGMAGGAGGGGGGVMGMASNASSAYSLLGGGTFGMGLNAGFSGLLGEAGLVGALDAGGIALGAGNIMGGLGTIAGALGTIALSIGAVVSLVKKFDTSGTMHTGALSQYSAAGGLANSTTHGAFGMGFGGVDYSAETEKFTGAMATSIVQMLDSTATTFGKQAGYKVATAFADDTSKDGAWGGLLISKLEDTIVNWDPTRTSKWAPKEFADGAAGKEQYLAAVAADVRVALESIGLPAWATGMLDKLGQGASIEQLAGAVDQINAAKAAFAGFAQYMPTFAGLADTAISKLVDASGGVGALAGNMGAFVDGFYRDSEKLAINTQNVTDALAKLGFEMPATRDEFKALVQSQIALGDAGAQTTAGLLAVSGAVSAVLPPFEDTAAGVRDAMKRLQSDTASLQIDLLRAQGNTTGADAAQRTLDTAGLTAAEIAVYDYNQALRAQITALDAATTAAAQQAEIRAGFERQLLELQGDTAALRLLDIAGMDAANVALYDRVQALTASQAAAEAARTAMQGQIDAFVSLYGDVASAMDEINPPAKTLVDAFRSTRDELTNLTNGLAQALGNLPEPTTLEQLRASMEALRGISQVSGDLNEQIFGIKVARGDQAAVGLLKSREASLFADLQTSADPAGAANRLSQIVLQRIAIEGKLEEQAINSRYKNEFDAAQAVADLESKNRRAQMEALRDQISGAGRLSEIAKSMQGFIAELKFGDLSALNPVDQLAAARGEYQRVLSAARGGDVTAAEQLQGVSAAFLREQQGYSGGATSGYASTFAQVMADLDAFGGMPVSDIALLQDQLASLDALERASATLQTAVIDTSQRQIDAISSVNVALLSRRDDINARADEQKAILTKQVDALNVLVEDQKAQITQAAATHQALMARLEEMSGNLDRLTSNSNQQAAQPA